MATLATTTLDVLGALMVSTIEAVVPRLTYQKSETWKHYEQGTKTATRTRRFKLTWNQGPFFVGGYFTPSAVETSATLGVVTDYAGEHQFLMPLVQDDWHQLRGTLARLTEDPDNGLVKLDTTARLALPPNTTTSNTFQVALTYELRYFQAQARG